ncbi:hypothetical protein AX14_000341 [Amanita brunnescens Koide BX004]|nr:hypothetical protein AX14_000341 [Amanita brunnescens Koide BX004]
MELQAEKYWKKRQEELAAELKDPEKAAAENSVKDKAESRSKRLIQALKKYEKHRQVLVKQGDGGWMAELNRYLGEVLDDAKHDMDVVKYWQDNHHWFPTLGRIALDILPCQASSVPCKRLFLASKQTATDLHLKLGAQRFEELQLMKYAWKHNIVDFTACNTAPVDINLKEYEDLAIADKDLEEFYD